MSNILKLLGLDEEELEWQDLALCPDMDTNLFYDDYEAEETVAAMTDEVCLSCPVIKQCMRSGVENNEWGVWGGIYLMNGKMDENRNSHKTQETWETLREVLLDADVL